MRSHPPVVHPVVGPHPETREKCLQVVGNNIASDQHDREMRECTSGGSNHVGPSVSPIAISLAWESFEGNSGLVYITHRSADDAARPQLELADFFGKCQSG